MIELTRTGCLKKEEFPEGIFPKTVQAVGLCGIRSKGKLYDAHYRIISFIHRKGYEPYCNSGCNEHNTPWDVEKWELLPKLYEPTRK